MRQLLSKKKKKKKLARYQLWAWGRFLFPKWQISTRQIFLWGNQEGWRFSHCVGPCPLLLKKISHTVTWWDSVGGESPPKGSPRLYHWLCHQPSVALKGEKQPDHFPGQGVPLVTFPGGWQDCLEVSFTTFHFYPHWTQGPDFRPHYWSLLSSPVLAALKHRQSSVTEHTVCVRRRISWVCISRGKARQLPGSRRPFPWQLYGQH